MKSRASVILFILSFSCSIIEDSDIQTQEQLDELTFAGFKIEQSRSGQPAITSTLIDDEEVNILDEDFNKVVKRVKTFTAPEMTGKMKYRSGATGTNLRFEATYLENDVPYTWRLMQGDSVIESYRFRYDENDTLFRIVTIIDPIDELPAKVVTIDNINYTNGLISSIDRESEIPGLAGTFSNFLMNTGGGDQPTTLSGFRFQSINIEAFQGNCSNNNYNCRSYNTQYSGSGGFVPGINVGIKAVSALGKTSKVIVDDSVNNGQCCRAADNYYFHPLMALQGLLNNGHLFLAIYLVDWVEPGEVLPSGGNQSVSGESITVNYLYDR